jgi:hypothetical protein
MLRFFSDFALCVGRKVHSWKPLCSWQNCLKLTQCLTLWLMYCPLFPFSFCYSPLCGRLRLDLGKFSPIHFITIKAGSVNTDPAFMFMVCQNGFTLASTAERLATKVN